MKRIILLIETSRDFGRQLIRGIARYSRLHGPWSFYKEPTDLMSAVPKLTSWKPDGIIMRDSKVIAKIASEHFIEKGIKNFAFIGFDGYDWSYERGKYFSELIRLQGCETHIYEPPKKIKNNDWEKEQQHVSTWLKSLPKPIGIFACNDDRGQHILEVCKMNGINVPEDAAVIGVDNDPIICEIGDPPLTSIALNVESAGYEAAALMNEMIKNQKLSGKQIIVSPSHIVQRQSSDVLAVNDPEVAKAIYYIRNNAKSKILVEDVVNTTCLSRRTLEKRFKQSIRRTIYGEIRRVRIELISKMLIETDLPVSEITSFFDFTDIEHISRYFKIEKGVGLREFRKINQFHRNY